MQESVGTKALAGADNRKNNLHVGEPVRGKRNYSAIRAVEKTDQSENENQGRK